MSLESSGAAATYRLSGRDRVEARLLPPAQLLATAPWAAATAVMLYGLAVWAGWWAMLAVVVIRVLFWLRAMLKFWAAPDEITMIRRHRQWPDMVPYGPERTEPFTALVGAMLDVTKAAGRSDTWLRIVLRTWAPEAAGMALPRRLVAVHISAARELPPHHLRAVVAHELGHQLIGGWIFASIQNLVATPLSDVFGLPSKVLIAVMSVRTRWEIVPTALMAALYGVFLAALTAAMVPAIGLHSAATLAMVCVLQPFPTMWLNWRGEFLADRVAADLGFGPALFDYFSTRGTKFEPFSFSHPGLITREIRICGRVRDWPSDQED